MSGIAVKVNFCPVYAPAGAILCLAHRFTASARAGRASELNLKFLSHL